MEGSDNSLAGRICTRQCVAIRAALRAIKPGGVNGHPGNGAVAAHRGRRHRPVTDRHTGARVKADGGSEPAGVSREGLYSDCRPHRRGLFFSVRYSAARSINSVGRRHEPGTAATRGRGVTGPRDWSPSYSMPSRGVRRPVNRRPRLGRGSLARGIVLSSLIVLIAAPVWAVLSGAGWTSASLPWCIAICVAVLFRTGAGGVISRRGAVAIAVVTFVIVAVCFTAGLVFQAALGHSPSGLDALGRREFWQTVPHGLASGATWSGWLPAGLLALAVTLIGVVPVLWTIFRGRVLRLGWPAILSTVGLVGLLLVISVVTSGLPSTGDSIIGTDSSSDSHDGIVLVVGDCLAVDPETIGQADGPLPMLVGCDQPHVTEVFQEISLGADPFEPYPGDEQVYYRAMERCSTPFETFIGIPASQSSVGLQVHRPMEDSWLAGERTARCLSVVTDPVSGTSLGAAK